MRSSHLTAMQYRVLGVMPEVLGGIFWLGPRGLSLPPSLCPGVWFRLVLPSPSCGRAAGLQSLTASPILLWESGEDTHHGSAFPGTRGLSHICSSTFMFIP